MEEVTFWATLGLTLVILLVPVIAYRFYLVDTQPTLSDRVRLKQRLSAKSLGYVISYFVLKWLSYYVRNFLC